MGGSRVQCGSQGRRAQRLRQRPRSWPPRIIKGSELMSQKLNKLVCEEIAKIPTQDAKENNLQNGRTYDQYYIYKLKDAKAFAAKSLGESQ